MHIIGQKLCRNLDIALIFKAYVILDNEMFVKGMAMHSNH